MKVTEEYFPELRLTAEMKEKIEIINHDGNDFLKNVS